MRLVSCTRRACSRSPLGPPACPRWRPACGARPAGARREPRACRGYQPGQWPPRPRPALRGPALTQERPAHDIALPWKEEEQRRSNRQPPAAARGRATAMVPRCHGWRSGEGARAGHGYPAAHSQASKRLIELHPGAQRAAKPPRRGGRGVVGSRGTGRAQRRRCLPLCPCGTSYALSTGIFYPSCWLAMPECTCEKS